MRIASTVPAQGPHRDGAGEGHTASAALGGLGEPTDPDIAGTNDTRPPTAPQKDIR